MKLRMTRNHHLRLFVLCCCFPLLMAKDDRNFSHGDECPQNFHCANLDIIRFPFTNAGDRNCGLQIKGCEGKEETAVLEIGNSTRYKVESITLGNKISVHDDVLQGFLNSKNCSVFNYSPRLPQESPMMSFEIVMEESLTVYKCNRTKNVSFSENLSRYEKCDGYDIYYNIGFNTAKDKSPGVLSSCSTIQLPVRSPHPKLTPNSHDPFSFLTSELQIQVNLSKDCYSCYYEKGGQCRLQQERFYCEEERRWTWWLILALLVVGVAVLMMILACCYRRKVIASRKKATHQPTIEAFLSYQLNLLTKRYSYSEIKKMTNSFKDKLGKGGYGTVYKGKLSDGRLAAVKVLSESKGNDEEFINEVASISRTSHVNIVSLLGFCLQSSKRALVYEFMPNGSLEKFIYNEATLLIDRLLDCNKLYNIAIGVARGLEYLHRGCNTKILHFNIKPHNILLDENFCPKISDFGLAKICPQKESIVSLVGARGTIGYIAPEVISRNFGNVSHKSDVYSYGMMVLEMIGGRKNVNVQVARDTEIYFPHWIYKRLKLKEDFQLQCIKNEDDKQIVRKMAVVSLWCIQTDPLTRPTMSRVIEMLEGARVFAITTKTLFDFPLNFSTSSLNLLNFDIRDIVIFWETMMQILFKNNINKVYPVQHEVKYHVLQVLKTIFFLVIQLNIYIFGYAACNWFFLCIFIDLD